MNAIPSCWRIIAASVPGTSHLERALPCQDAHAFRVLPGGELLAAVSDGAGSAERSREGAYLVVEAALTGLESLCRGEIPADESSWHAAMIGLFGEIHQRLIDFADTASIPLRELAATLTCALITEQWLVVGQLGDGAAVADSADGVDGSDDALFLAVQPQRGEYANEAYLLTQAEALQHTEVYAVHRSVRVMALTTDGLLRLAFNLPGYEPHPRFFQPLFSFVSETTDLAQAQAELADFLASERVCARSDDDKTLLLAIRTDAPNE